MLSLAAAQAAERPWTDAGVKDGVMLAYRDDAALQAREVRAITELPFAADAVAAVACDFTQYGSLVLGVQEARLIAGQPSGDHEVYLHYAPRYVVVAARDVVIRVERSGTGEGASQCRWSEVVGRVSERRGVVRMPLLRGSWTIERLSASRSRVTYQLAVKPGGSLPGWLVRRGALGELAEIIERLAQRLGGPVLPPRTRGEARSHREILFSVSPVPPWLTQTMGRG
jgi:hypothetical protein